MKNRLVVPVMAAAFGVFLFAYVAGQLTPGVHAQGTDWAMYVTHARNIVKGLPYAQSGYVFQPESTTEVGANSYPSGYPLLLAPFYAIFGLNIKIFKLLDLSFLVLSLWPAYLYARRTLPQIDCLLLIVVMGFSLQFLGLFNNLGSDSPYQLASLFVLLLLLRIYDRRLNETKPWKWGLLAGVCIAGAYLIRPFGLALLLAAAGVELLRKRRLTTFLLALALAFVPPLVLNNLFLHRDSSYAYQFTFSIPLVVRHAAAYLGYFSYIFANPLSQHFRYLLWAPALLLALLALSQRLRAGVRVPELYLLVVLAVISVYWSPSAKYLVCIMPIYVVYVFEGFRSLVARVPHRFTLPLQVAAVALVLFAPAANAVLMRMDPNDTLVTAVKYEELCASIHRQSAPDGLVIFWNPRVLALSTGRRASGWPAEGPPERMAIYLRRVLPGYIVADKSRPEDRHFLMPMIAGAPLRLPTVYENDQFILVRVLDDRKGKSQE
ncbi:MAG: glycosyltransferase family 39 protein [Bryobacteraceae bacterium]